MSTAVRAGTDRDAFTRAAAGQAMDDPTGRPEIALVPDLSARRPADHRARQCGRRDLYRIEAITDRNFRIPMGATVVNGDTAASGAVSAKGNHPMNRNLFFDPIALRANAVPATVES
jgi:hypothetical protein